MFRMFRKATEPSKRASYTATGNLDYRTYHPNRGLGATARYSELQVRDSGAEANNGRGCDVFQLTPPLTRRLSKNKMTAAAIPGSVTAQDATQMSFPE